jgi:transposase
MSTMTEKKPERQRRNFTDDFKAGAIRLVLEEGRSVAAVAHDLDLTRGKESRISAA